MFLCCGIIIFFFYIMEGGGGGWGELPKKHAITNLEL